MVEIRKEVTKNEWSIIAPARSDRPFDFPKKSRDEEEAAPDCPFCPGNESNTPPEVYAIREGDNPDESSWKVRVFSNKYPALDSDDTAAVIEGDIFESMGGFGYHEVIAETPKHRTCLNDLTIKEIELVLRAYVERATSLAEVPEIEYVSIFRNQGKKAGASLSHPHSQIMATSFVPGLLRAEYREAGNFYDRKDDCLHCRLLEAEKFEKNRIILENDGFIVFSPFGSRFPYETHIYPLEHRHDFRNSGSGEISLLAKTLKQTLTAMSEVFGDFFPYNYSIHTGPVGDFRSCEDFENIYHWHVEIIPRLTTPAGFERGSGNYINIVSPEQAARKLRKEMD